MIFFLIICYEVNSSKILLKRANIFHFKNFVGDKINRYNG